MKRFFRWFVIFAALLGFTALGFSLYSQFLLDYNLENLELALSAAENNLETASPVSHNVYRTLVQDLAVEEAVQEDVDLKTLALLEIASRSFEEVLDRAGNERARFYLTQVTRSKLPARSRLLRLTDTLYRHADRFYRSLFTLASFLQRRFFPTLSEIREPFEFSSILLLRQAEDREREWRLEEAAALYRKYLKLYPTRPDRGFVSISLAHVLVKQKKPYEAQRILRDVQIAFAGGEEGRIAAGLFLKISKLNHREQLIEQLQGVLPLHQGTQEGEFFKFRLALAYLSVYQLTEAQQILRSLEAAQNTTLRQKAKFYLGWIYKMRSQYDQSAQVFLDLVEDPQLEHELGLGLKAQLADIYYQKKEVQKSLSQYEALGTEAAQDLLSRKAAQEAWLALAELEQAGIYYFELRDPIRGESHLRRAGELFPSFPEFKLLKSALEQASQSQVNLRERAFQALRKGMVHLAYELFNRHLSYSPRDAWAHAGLGTTHIFLADLPSAREENQKGYDFNADEYTASALAYLFGFLEQYELSITLYQEALRKAPDYIPARYNLACMYIKTNKHQEAFDLLTGLETEFHNVKGLMRSKILNNMGYSLWQLGKREDAAGKFRKALLVTPNFADAKRNLSQIEGGGIPQTTR